MGNKWNQKRAGTTTTIAPSTWECGVMEKKEWENREINEKLNCMDFNLQLKHLNSAPVRVLNGLSINQLGKESNSLEIGSQGGRVNTHHAMDKENLSKMPKEK